MLNIVETQITSRTSLSVIVPLFNEQENVQPLVESIFSVLGADPCFLELLLIDDGSSDRTVEVASQLANNDPRIRLVCHSHNRGLGAAIRTGLEQSKGELILYTDADLPFDFKVIPELLECATPRKVIAGSRTNRDEGWRRWLLTKGYNLLCNQLFDLRLSDVNFACKIIPRRALAGMNLKSEGSFIDAELLLECRRQGLTIAEFPLTYYPRVRGLSTLSRPAVVLGILAEMAGYLFRPLRTASLTLLRAAKLRQHRYRAAATVFLLAVLFIVLFNPEPAVALFAIFLPVVFLIARYCGGAAGVLSTGMAAAFTDCLQLAPFSSLRISSPRELFQLGTFITVALSFTGFAALQKRTRYARRRK